MLNRLSQTLAIASLLSVPILPAWAEAETESTAARPLETSPAIAEQPATTVSEWRAQVESALVQITAVRLEFTESGLQVVLETAAGELAIPTTQTVGNALIADIPNAALALPEGGSFEQFAPAEGIALVSVTNESGDQVRIAITGTDAPPVGAVTATGLAVTLGEVVAGAEDDAIQVVVTGAGDEGYAPSSASTATRTDAPLRDIPRSIQVVPQQVFEDQAGNRIDDATRNVSSVVQSGGFAGTADQLAIRGFATFEIFRDGFRDPAAGGIFETSNIEQFEVLKGPASVLYGNTEPGGIINLVTEQPLPFPNYEFDLQAGSFGFLRPTLDLSGPLTESADVRYRVNLAYERSDTFRDFDQDVRRGFIAPVLAWDISDSTSLTVDFSYLDDKRPFDRGLIAVGRDIVDVPQDRIFGEPDDFREIEETAFGYRLEHEFSDNWSIRNAFRLVSAEQLDFRAEPLELDEDTGILTRNFRSNDDTSESYAFQTQLEGQFATGSIEHNLLLGIDLDRTTFAGTQSRAPDGLTPDINIFDPVYNQVIPPTFDQLTNVVRDSISRTDSLGIFAQNQIDLTDNFKLLLAGRWDFVEQRNDNNLGDDSIQSPDAFSPSIGLLYRPIEPLSIYANYARSFQPNFGTAVDGSFLEPERGTQSEIGLRGELFDGNLIANLAAYTITKTNLATTDPDNPDFSIPVSEQRSRGIELDIAGEILPGWNVIASYGYIDAEFTEENFGVEPGGRIQNIPENTFSLWTTYEIQTGSLQGLGLGAGVFYVGERAGDFEDTFDLPSYWRTDATVFYSRDNWRAGLNVQNLFDERYFKSNNFGRVAIEPGEPLTIVGTFSIDF
ncbi:MAG: TonB-dependent receptor [Cyanobacteria bacterium P01_D01_bin.115]